MKIAVLVFGLGASILVKSPSKSFVDNASTQTAVPENARPDPLAKFDNVQVSSANNLTKLVDSSAGGALYYHGWARASFDIVGVSLQPSSTPNAITFGLLIEPTEGWLTIFLMNSSILYFDQKSVSSACAATDRIPVAMSFTVVATGREYGTGDEFAITFFYDPTGLPVGETSNKRSFPALEFSQLNQMTYTIEIAEVNAANAVLLLSGQQCLHGLLHVDSSLDLHRGGLPCVSPGLESSKEGCVAENNRILDVCFWSQTSHPC